MQGRKTLIKRLVESGAHLKFDPGPWMGEMVVSTRHTVYRFMDGTCIAVHRQDNQSSRGDFVGMKIFGWLVDEELAPAVSRTWRPGASAILIRPGAGGDAIAMTSPTIQLRRADPLKSSGIRQGLASSWAGAGEDGPTRIHVPAARAR